MKAVRILAIIAICALVSSQAWGSLVVSAQYPFTGSSFASSDIDSLTTAGNISSTFGNSSGIITSAGNPAPSYSVGAPNIGTSMDTTKYLSFTLTRFGANLIDLNTGGGYLTLDVASATSGRTVNWAIASSVAGASTILASGSTSSGVFSTQTLTFSTLSNPNLYDNLTSVTFYIYAWNTGTQSSSVLFDNITLHDTISTTPVPEPIAYALPLFGLIFIGGTAGRFYWRRQKAEGRI